jgi:hypothetical protein
LRETIYTAYNTRASDQGPHALPRQHGAHRRDPRTPPRSGAAAWFSIKRTCRWWTDGSFANGYSLLRDLAAKPSRSRTRVRR